MTTPITDNAGTDCLLIVDANEEESQLLVSMLSKLGFELLPARSAKQTLEILSTRQPDLILLDMHLPDMDGFEMCRRIQENPQWADIPIVFFSDSKDKDLVVRALESGGVDHISKPFHKQELLSRVRTQLMLKTARDYAKRLAQDKDETLGMISHHLQSHLVGMHMSAQMLLDRAQANTDPKLRLMAENIRNSSSQLRAFLKAFLANAAADHGLRIKMETVKMAEAVIRVLQQYEDVARVKNIILRATMPSHDITIRADVSAFGQVLDNLVSNAIKFSPPGNEVVVNVKDGASLVECSVRDNGAGFTEADKARMFHRYARLSARPTGGEPSTNVLGLSIVKRLVHAMNGELTCESVVGKGTTFTVRLPTVASSQATLESGSHPAAQYQQQPMPELA